jgi:glycosyltransferase involved in cell wall biosynthesis
MTRALLVGPSSAPGGAERVLASLARHLPDRGIDVSAVILQPGPFGDRLAELGCPVEVIDAGRTRRLHRTAGVIARVSVRARAADVVFSNQTKGHIYGGLAARAARRPAVWWQHGTPTRSPMEVLAAGIPAAAIVANSTDSAEAQQRLARRHRIEVIRPGIDLATVRRSLGAGAALRREHGWGDLPLVGIVGRLQEDKGQDLFLRAAARVAATHPDARFLVVGGAVLGWEGDYPERLRQLAHQLGVAHRVDFVGHQADPYPWLDALDVVVQASWRESFGLVIPEAMALGKAVVTTASGGPTHIVESGVSGLVVPPGDSEAMSRAIGRILGDGMLRSTLQQGARVRADSFDDAGMVDRLATVLSEVSGARRTRSGGRLPAPRAEPSQRPRAMAPELTHETVGGMLEAPRGGVVLDAGAGEGAFTRVLGERGFRVVAAGIRPEEFVASQDQYLVCDCDRTLPFRDGSLEGVAAIELIPLLEMPFGFVREVARCLEVGGWFILATPNVLSITSKLSLGVRGAPLYLSDREFDAYGNISSASLVDIRRIASRTGLRVERVAYSRGKLPIPKVRHWRVAQPRFLQNRHFGESVVVKLRKLPSETPGTRGHDCRPG